MHCIVPPGAPQGNPTGKNKELNRLTLSYTQTYIYIYIYVCVCVYSILHVGHIFIVGHIEQVGITLHVRAI